MRMRLLSALIIGLLLGGTVNAQVAEEFNPPRSNCCLANTAKSLADQLQDWNQLGRYHQANQQLKDQPADPKRVVFMGDSITDVWRLVEYFPGKPYVNRGIGGQTTPQMLVRMYPDVIDLKPAVMVLLAGTNDIARNTGPMTAEMIQQNIMAMTELAQHHGIKVVLCSLLPVSDYPFLKQQSGQAPPPAGPGPGAPRIKMTEGRPPADILKLNAWISAPVRNSDGTNSLACRLRRSEAVASARCGTDRYEDGMVSCWHNAASWTGGRRVRDGIAGLLPPRWRD